MVEFQKEIACQRHAVVALYPNALMSGSLLQTGPNRTLLNPHRIAIMSRTPLFRRALATLALLGAFIGCSPASDHGQVAVRVANLLQNEHYNDQRLDDSVSAELLQNYLDFLDMGRLYFLESDVDYFRAKYEKTLDNLLMVGDISPAMEIYGIYQHRVMERVKWVKVLVKEEKFTFNSDRTTEISRKDKPWPATPAESDALWRNMIEGELLQEVLRQEAAEQPGEDGEERETFDKTPPELVLDRYDRILESLGENTDEDIAGFYLKSLSHAYDPHSEYFTQSEYDNFRVSMQKSLEGIGALLSMTDSGYAEIKGLVVNGPAHKAGELQVGDQIVAVGQGQNGELADIMHMKLQKVVDLIRGKRGSIVRLKIIPNGSDPSATQVIQIRRNKVDLKESLARAELIETKGADGEAMKLGWIDLPSFYSDMDTGQTSVTRDTKRLLERLTAEGIDGLILDLRANGGGSLEEAINLTGLFIPQGPVVLAKDSRDNIDVKRSRSAAPVYEGPMVVLTSRSSASASEILAAALQDYNRALIVGEGSTFGKGTVQQLLPVTLSPFSILQLPGAAQQAGALKLTIQKFYRISGGSTQKKGVIPDLNLPSITDAMDHGESALKNPLPYDEIPRQNFALFEEKPLPVDTLAARSKKRIDDSADFQWILEEKARFEERREKNRISLNKEARKREMDEQDAREEQRREELKSHYAKLKKEEEGLFEVYSLTLDWVDEPKLRLLSDVTDQELSGMMMEGRREKTEEEKALEPPHGFRAVKREGLAILIDLIDLKSDREQLTISQSNAAAPEATRAN